MNTVITLTTDFGTEDAYVGTMKGVILSINPKAILVDLCHQIEPQNIAQAAFVLGTAYPFFPQGTIHLVVVDPGVGSQRRAIILVTPSAYFVAPDNGVLSYVIEETPAFQAIALTNPRFWLSPVSSTFHGRDIFAPVAAHLSLGVPPEDFGEKVPSLLTFPIPRPQRGENGELVGHILHIDHFGNLITDIKRTDLPSGEISIEVAGRCIEGLSTSYSKGGELMAIIGSSQNLEIAAKDESAADLLGVRAGDEIRVKKETKS